MRWYEFRESTKRTFRQMIAVEVAMILMAVLMFHFVGSAAAVMPAMMSGLVGMSLILLYFTVPLGEDPPSEADDIKFLLEQLGKNYEDRDFQRIDAITNRLGK